MTRTSWTTKISRTARITLNNNDIKDKYILDFMDNTDNIDKKENIETRITRMKTMTTLTTTTGERDALLKTIFHKKSPLTVDIIGWKKTKS